jgi:transcriptional regulator with XRE-family HTH domain
LDTDTLPLNLRRLLFFHHASAREAARALGVTEHAVSAWLTGKRRPGTDALIRISEVYDVDTRLLLGDPLVFAEALGNRVRVVHAEENLGQREHLIPRVRPPQTKTKTKRKKS